MEKALTTETEAFKAFIKFLDDLKFCRKCLLTPRFVDYPKFRFRPIMAFVGHSPSLYRKEPGFTFGGRSREVFEKMLESLNLKREEVYGTNLIKCTQPETKTGELKHCSQYIWRELNIIQPWTVVLMGREVLSEVVGPVSYYKPYIKNGFTFVGFMHPCTVLYGTVTLETYLNQAKRILKPFVEKRATKLDDYFRRSF